MIITIGGINGGVVLEEYGLGGDDGLVVEDEGVAV